MAKRSDPVARAKLNAELVEEVRGLLKGTQLEVLGQLDSQALCCGNGTVAIVKIDRGGRPPDRTRSARRPRKA